MRDFRKVQHYTRKPLFRDTRDLSFTLVLSESDFDALPTEVRNTLALADVKPVKPFHFGF